MNKIHLVALHFLLFVMSVQVVAFQAGWVWLPPIVCIVSVAVLPYINERRKESIMIILPLAVSIAGLSIGLLLNFWVGNYRMNEYMYSILAAVISFMSSVMFIPFYRKWHAVIDGYFSFRFSTP